MAATNKSERSIKQCRSYVCLDHSMSWSRCPPCRSSCWPRAGRSWGQHRCGQRMAYPDHTRPVRMEYKTRMCSSVSYDHLLSWNKRSNARGIARSELKGGQVLNLDCVSRACNKYKSTQIIDTKATLQYVLPFFRRHTKRWCL